MRAFSGFKSLVAMQFVRLDIKYKLLQHLATDHTARVSGPVHHRESFQCHEFVTNRLQAISCIKDVEYRLKNPVQERDA
jgi:hypothetical protein